MNFWQGFTQNSFDEVFEQEDLSLKTLLDHDQVVMEFRNRNAKLLDYLKNHGPALLDYMLNEAAPSPSTKYPFICAEMLQLENDQVLAWFFPEESPLDKECVYYEQKEREEQEVESPPEQNQQEGSPVPTQYYLNKEVVHKGSMEESPLMTSLDSEAIVEQEPRQPSPPLKEQPPQQSLLDRLFSYLAEDFDHFNITSAGYFAKVLMNLLRQREQDMLAYIFRGNAAVDGLILNIHFFSVAEVVATLLTTEESLDGDHPDHSEARWGLIERLFQILLNENHAETLSNCEYILSEVFLKENYVNKQNLLQNLKGDRELVQQLFDNLLCDDRPASQRANCRVLTYMLSSGLNLKDTLRRNAARLVDYLAQGNSTLQKYNVLALLLELLKLSDSAINKQLKDKELLVTLVQLVEENRWNNMMHVQIDKIVGQILEGDSYCLIMQLVHCPALRNLLAQSVQHYAEEEVRQGHMGFLIQLLQQVRRFAQLNHQPFELEPEFEEYLDLQLERQNVDFTKILINKDSSKKSMLKQYLEKITRKTKARKESPEKQPRPDSFDSSAFWKLPSDPAADHFVTQFLNSN